MSNMLTSNFLADVGVGRVGDAAMAEGVKPNVEKLRWPRKTGQEGSLNLNPKNDPNHVQEKST
jgi:hypothetical protein